VIFALVCPGWPVIGAGSMEDIDTADICWRLPSVEHAYVGEPRVAIEGAIHVSCFTDVPVYDAVNISESWDFIESAAEVGYI
jgi:hypothetical protein